MIPTPEHQRDIDTFCPGKEVVLAVDEGKQPDSFMIALVLGFEEYDPNRRYRILEVDYWEFEGQQHVRSVLLEGTKDKRGFVFPRQSFLEAFFFKSPPAG